MIPRIGLVLGLLAALSASIRAQDIYLDFGPPGSPPPSSSFGASLGVPGAWNQLSAASFTDLPLVDVNGQATTATARVLVGGTSFVHVPQPGLTGDAAALLETCMEDSYAPSELLVLVPAGRWQLLIYGAPANGFQFGPEIVQWTIDAVPVEGAPSGQFTVTPYQGTLAGLAVGSIVIDSIGGQYEIDLRGEVGGMQLVRLDGAHPYCSGTFGNCPCGAGQPGRGCPSSFDPAGAMLTGSGVMQVSNDTLQLVAASLSNSVVTVFQGTTIANGGQGAAFGDGLRCAGGTIVRLASKPTAGGILHYPGAGDLPISQRGGVPASGGFRTYQVWYRNAGSYCTSSTFNLTNAVAVLWSP